VRRALLCTALAGALVAGANGAAGSAEERLVFATGGDGISGRLEIATVNADGSGFARVTRHDPSGYQPRWTRDGRSIVVTTEDAVTEFGAQWTMRPNGTHFRLLPDGVASPSGRLVAR